MIRCSLLESGRRNHLLWLALEVRHVMTSLSIGCTAGVQEATLALTEAMHIAQQSGDNMALAHSLAMLSHLVDSASLSAAPVLSSGAPSRRAEAKHIHLLRLLRK